MQEAVEITVKYQGYISRQLRQVEEMKRLERTRSRRSWSTASSRACGWRPGRSWTAFGPKTWDRPAGYPGVSPADVAVLMVYLKQNGGG